MLKSADTTLAGVICTDAEFTRLAQDLQRLAGETVLPLQRELYLRAAKRFADIGEHGHRHALAEIRAPDGDARGVSSPQDWRSRRSRRRDTGAALPGVAVQG